MYQYSPDGWRGGSRSEIVATDAKMGTPIDAMTPSGHDTLLYDVYCMTAHHWVYCSGDRANRLTDVNSDNYLRQRSMNTSAYTWTDGPLHKLNIKVLDADRVGMRACLYLGRMYDQSSTLTSIVTASGLLVLDALLLGLTHRLLHLLTIGFMVHSYKRCIFRRDQRSWRAALRGSRRNFV